MDIRKNKENHFSGCFDLTKWKKMCEFNQEGEIVDFSNQLRHSTEVETCLSLSLAGEQRVSELFNIHLSQDIIMTS